MKISEMPAGSQPHVTFRTVRADELERVDEHHPAAAGLLSSRDAERYRQFPGASDAFPLFCYLEQDGRAASYLRCIPDEVIVDGRAHPWAWTADNFTVPEARGRGLSTLLQRSTTEYLHEHGIGRGSVFSTDVTLHIFEKLGFVVAGYARRFLFIRSATPIVEAHVAHAALRRVLSAAAVPVAAAAATSMSTWNRLLKVQTQASVPATFPADELAVLLSRLAGRRPAGFSPDPSLLRRKLETADRAGRHTLHLVRGASGEVVAYMVIRERFTDRPLAGRYRGFTLMTLVDFAFEDGDRTAAAGIVANLVRTFFASDAQVLEIVASNPALCREATRRGLRPVGKGMSFNYSVPSDWGWPADLNRPERWPLTHFCGDGFTY